MKIAVFLPNWIGDVVMATPTIRSLRQSFPGAVLIGVQRPYVAGVLEGAPWIDRQILIDPKSSGGLAWFRSVTQLRKEKVDLAVLFPNSFRSALVAFMGGCRRRIGYRRYGRGWLLSKAVSPVRDGRGKLVPSPIMDAYGQLAVRAGCPLPSRRMELFTTEADEIEADAVWNRAGWTAATEVVCLNPGAAFGSAKHWSVGNWVTVAQDLADRRRCGVLVLCGPNEIALAREIQSLSERKRVHGLSEHPLSIGLTKSCIRRCDLLITTDSGPRHFAAAFDRPVVTLFGPTHIAWTETYFPKAIHLWKQVDCGPCQRRCCPLDHRCMRQITSTEVLRASGELLRRFAPLFKKSPAQAREVFGLEGESVLGERQALSYL